MPHRRVWDILVHDKVALSEVLSGLFLVALRGFVLLGSSRLFPLGSDVAQVLHEIGVTEERWGSYLLVCGICQIFLARTRHTGRRSVVTLAILLGFVTMGAGYYEASGSLHAIPPSIICMTVFEGFLLARVWLDWRRGERF